MRSVEGLVDVGAEVPVAGVVEGVDAALGVDGEEGLAVGLLAEGADLGVEGAAEVAEGAGQVEAVQGVEVEGGGGDLAAGAGGGDVQAAELGPGLDGGGEDGVPVAGGGGVAAQGVGPVLGLLDVPASGLPAGGAQCGVDGDGEAGGGGAVGVDRPVFVGPVAASVGLSAVVRGWSAAARGGVDDAYAEVGE